MASDPSNPTVTVPSRYQLTGGLAFCLPYLGMWGFTLYLNLRVIPRMNMPSGGTTFTLCLNAAQFLPLAVMAFIKGRGFAALAWAPPGVLIRKIVRMTLLFVAYEVILALGLLFVGSWLDPGAYGMTTGLWVMIPVVMFLVLSLLFGMFHTISGVILAAWRPASRPPGY